MLTCINIYVTIAQFKILESLIYQYDRTLKIYALAKNN